MFSEACLQDTIVYSDVTPELTEQVLTILRATTKQKDLHLLENKSIHPMLTSVFVTGHYRLLNPKYYVEVKKDMPYVCISTKSAYYCTKYTENKPHLKSLFKKIHASARTAKLVKQVLVNAEVCSAERGFISLGFNPETGKTEPTNIGNGQLTKLYLHTFNQRTPRVSKESEQYIAAKEAYTDLILMLGNRKKLTIEPTWEYMYKKQEWQGHSKVTIEKNKRFGRKVAELIRRKNESLPEHMKDIGSAQIITNENLLFGARIYSGMTLVKKEYRNALMDKEGLVENDLKSAVVNMLYMMETGEKFMHPMYNNDIYLYMAGEILKEDYTYELGMHVRGLMKEIITVATGHEECEDNQLMCSIIYHLEKNGFAYENFSFDKFKQQKSREYKELDQELPVDSVLHTEYLKIKWIMLKNARLEQRRKYETYCKRNKNLQPMERIPLVKAGDVFNLLRYNDIVSNMAYKGKYKEYFGVETMMNVALIGYALENNIELYTVHDAFITQEKQMNSELINKRNEFSNLATKTYKQILNVLPNKAYNIAQEIKNKQTTTRKQIKETIKKETEEILKENITVAICYRETLRHYFVGLIRDALHEKWQEESLKQAV